ncbi:histidine kinase HHK3 [Exophiala viscosa]|uniref:histidine kinase n=1 Tax=Exophiala viscosa TaxID=2486360 RepID=A0AAN6E1X8_9EURO|nr:histidine kinase HHK3 [Exophiala viscosa]KAI1623963.1 histidine kinase HHK3 [Exophiala viscosa]
MNMSSSAGDSAAQAFFPRADSPATARDPDQSVKERPHSVGPVFDHKHANDPLLQFDSHVHESVYGKDPTEAPEAAPPPQPEWLHDRYLSPSLTHNERLRLTVLWYYTRLITQDDQLMTKLQDMVKIVQKYMGWEFAIVGTLDEAVYTRLATANLPLAILPRRESTCAHTVNQKPGSVFSITDMPADWRFKSSPHVEYGGLKSYAGTQLRLKTDKGEEIALGSLCIASNTVEKPLTPEQKVALVSFAAMLTSEIVSTTRQNRLRAKQSMSEALMKLQAHDYTCQEEFEAAVLDVVRAMYSSANVSIQHSTDDTLLLEGGTSLPFTTVQSGLWENTRLIDEAITSGNQARLFSTQTARAVVGNCARYNIFLVVSTNEMQRVYDDYDAWFVRSCAQMLGDFVQQQHLQEALRAKEAFLRGITHQLRTPIHGVLTSSELLAEELTSKHCTQRLHVRNDFETALSYVSTIQRSGTELMSTVNDMLKLNNWSRHKAQNIRAQSYNLRNLEADVMADIFSTFFDHYHKDVSISFEGHGTVQESIVSLDPVLLKDALQPLILNALHATTHGTITISTKVENSVLQFDIVDTGCGIPIDAQARIFQAFEKGTPHARGAGLGLTLANQAVQLLGGTLSIVASTEGVGSHFRVVVPGLVFACGPRTTEAQVELKSLPKRFYQLPGSGGTPILLSFLTRHLVQRGFVETANPHGSLIIMEKPNPDGLGLQVVKSLKDPHTIICVTLDDVSTSGHLSLLQQMIPIHHTIAVSGPFYAGRIDQALLMADQQYALTSVDKNVASPTTGITNAAALTTGDLASLAALSLSSPHPLKKAVSSFRALLVDDNSVNLRILRMYCEKRAIPYVLATDGDEAIEQFQQASVSNPIHLILMDLQMPRCDGLIATAKIRAYEKETDLKPCTIFMVTGQDSPGDRLISMEAGANEYFVKPVSLKRLDKEIARYFNKS